MSPGTRSGKGALITTSVTDKSDEAGNNTRNEWAGHRRRLILSIPSVGTVEAVAVAIIIPLFYGSGMVV